MGSAIVPLDKSMISSYRSSAVTISLTVTVLLQIAMQDLSGLLAPFWEGVVVGGVSDGGA